MNRPRCVLFCKRSRALETIGPLDEAEDFGPRHGTKLAFLENFLDLHHIRRFSLPHGEQDRQGHLAFLEVVGDGFSKNVLRRGQVEQIVYQLKRHAEALADLRELLGRPVIHTGGERRQLHTAREEVRCLALDNVQQLPLGRG